MIYNTQTPGGLQLSMNLTSKKVNCSIKNITGIMPFEKKKLGPLQGAHSRLVINTATAKGQLLVAVSGQNYSQTLLALS